MKFRFRHILFENFLGDKKKIEAVQFQTQSEKFTFLSFERFLWNTWAQSCAEARYVSQGIPGFGSGDWVFSNFSTHPNE